MIGSPLKKARPSISGPEHNPLGASSGVFPSALGDVLAKAEAAQTANHGAANKKDEVTMEEEEEL
jgi:hypothetical protein